SVSSLSRSNSIKLYPNPSSSSISVRSSISLLSRTYRVYNLQGALVLEGSFVDGISGGSSSSNGGGSSKGGGSSNGGRNFDTGDFGTIPTANLPNGTYFLQLESEKSRNITSKFIVQH
ncbi:MAG: Secretion system C-terminal sorting domain, partial [Bacteroidota bacterium]